MNKKIRMTLLIFVLLLGGCAPSQGELQSTQNIDEVVQSTFQALTALADVAPAETSQPDVDVTSTATAASPAVASTESAAGTGSITGIVASSFVHVVAFLVGTDQYYPIDLTNGKQEYQIFVIDNLPDGVYHLLAFTNPGGMAAPFPSAYSTYVKCGMTTFCKDHSLIDVIVEAGQVTGGVYILDTWGVPEFTPYYDLYFADHQPATPSAKENSPESTALPLTTGTLGGELFYDTNGTPAMIVVAYRLDGAPNEFYFTVTEFDNPFYSIYFLPQGSYHVVAYTLGGDLGNGSFYPEFLPTGYTDASHTLLEVEVKADEYTKVNPQDWETKADSLPDFPLP